MTRFLKLRAALAAAFVLAAMMMAGGGAEARALPEQQCMALRDGLEREIGVTPAFQMWVEEMDVAPIGVQEACRLSFRTTGVIFETAERRGFTAAIDAIRGALAANEWFETPAQSPFAADGPLSTRFAVTKDRAVCVVEVSLSAAPRRLGVAAEAVAEWRLMAMRPIRRLYSIRLACVAPESG